MNAAVRGSFMMPSAAAWASWSELQRTRSVRAEVLQAFEEAFHRGKSLSFAYVDRRGTPSHRHVEPHGLLLQAPAWYLLAYDLERDAPRMFRLDRMAEPRLGERDFLPRPLSVFEPLVTEVVANPLGQHKRGG